MARGKYGNSIGRAAPAVVCAALLCLAFTARALAAPPVHARENALDVPSLNHACGAAVDSKADVYAASAGEGKIEVFAPASHTTPIAEIANANEPCALAVQSDGTLYVSERATGEVVRYEPSEYPPTESVIYDPREAIDSSGEAKGIAVDRADDRLYVAEGDHVAIYDKEGAFQANAGEGDLTQATGVSAYTYIITGNIPTNLKRHYYLSVADAASDQVKVFSGREDGPLKLRRTISGVDEGEDGEISAAEEFGFGAQGAYLAADPGNESRETRACVALAEQACTQGHFYLYDAANEAVDEFDATGEFLDQLKSAAFEDAEPTAMAIERSGAASDGTLYVSAGKGAGAKLLAFAPLHQPSRAQFEEPASTLSKKLKGAKAVAVDCSGYVYVAAESLIRVYSPAGVELSSAADTHNAQDLAADCEGNVYVVDKSPKEMTYYSPSKYPPEAATTYTRHEPGLLAATGLNAVAVNPADDHSFLVGEGTFTDVMVEFGPVSEGTPEVGKCGAGIAPFGNRVDVDVYAKTGQLYVSANPSTATGTAISTLTCGAESELLIRQIKGGGCPDGEPGAASAIAVDQSNGHIVQFAPGQPGASAREYDSAGACVAQFGTFGENNAGYKVAVDSSCALHEPPLSEQTTPTCAEFDPANGNAYVAYDATNNKVQPYDVTAFGPLGYPEVGVTEEFSLTVVKAGSGTGTVTSEPAGISCGGTCTADFEAGEEVTLTATPSGGSTFAGWSGPSSGPGCTGTGTCVLTMSAAREVTATFNPPATPKFKLKVTKAGTGTGSVSSSPSGINSCTATCEAEFTEGTEVTLTATPSGGSTFAGWSGPSSGPGCTGTGTCVLTMSAAKEVTATFNPPATPKFKLTVALEGTGSGIVTSSPGLISCEPFCEDEFEEGASVTLTASPEPGSLFMSWKHCDSGGINGRQCTVTMDKAKEVEAVFITVHALTVSKTAGSGPGKVQSKPGGVLCLFNCGEATAVFKEGATVTLNPTPAKHFHLAEWSGDCSGSGACELTMGGDHAVSALFEEDPKFTLSLSKTGAGQGIVKSHPAGVLCSYTCSALTASFYEGEEVTLEVSNVGKGSSFAGWSGGGCSGTGICTVTMDSAKSVEASFK